MLWMLRAVAALIIAAAILRGIGLIRSAPGEQSAARGDLQLRTLLGLPGDHRIASLIVADVSPHGSAVLWGHDGETLTAVMPDSTGRLRIGRALVMADDRSAESLRELDPTPWPALPTRLGRLSIRLWDASAAVFVTVGPDGQPGIAGVDDDGDGRINDLGELGATGSDDRVVAPGQDGYSAAASGEIVARVISRGALVEHSGDLVLPTQRLDSGSRLGREVWIEFAGAAGLEPIRLCLHVH